jgi:hypothetical protein
MPLFSLLLQQSSFPPALCSFDAGRKETYLFCCKFLANTAEKESERASGVYLYRFCAASKEALALPEQNHLQKRIECFLLAQHTITFARRKITNFHQ